MRKKSFVYGSKRPLYNAPDNNTNQTNIMNEEYRSEWHSIQNAQTKKETVYTWQTRVRNERKNINIYFITKISFCCRPTKEKIVHMRFIFLTLIVCGMQAIWVQFELQNEKKQKSLTNIQFWQNQRNYFSSNNSNRLVIYRTLSSPHRLMLFINNFYKWKMKTIIKSEPPKNNSIHFDYNNTAAPKKAKKKIQILFINSC